MNKLALLYRSGMYETLVFTKHTLAFRERYELKMLTNLYQHAKKVLGKQ